MHEVAILYAYCNLGDNRPTVEDFYARLVRDNGGVPVVPLVLDSPKWVEGTVDVATLETVWPTADDLRQGYGYWRWAHCDQVFWRYLRSPGRVEANRYALFDWDVMSTGMPVREFFGDLWDENLACMRVYEPYRDRTWDHWYQELFDYVGGRRNARAVVPVTGVLLSRYAARLAADTTPPPELKKAFCEAYIANLCVRNGIELKENVNRRDMFGVAYDPQTPIRPHGIYHPVKDRFATHWPCLRGSGR